MRRKTARIMIIVAFAFSLTIPPLLMAEEGGGLSRVIAPFLNFLPLVTTFSPLPTPTPPAPTSPLPSPLPTATPSASAIYLPVVSAGPSAPTPTPVPISPLPTPVPTVAPPGHAIYLPVVRK